MKRITEERFTISEAIKMLTECGSNAIQFQVFEDKEKKKPTFAAFFVMGENGEPKEAVDYMTLLNNKWKKYNHLPKISAEGGTETSYVIQQIDTEGVYDITRPCKTVNGLMNLVRQDSIEKLGRKQRVIKRIEIPLIESCVGVDNEDRD